MTDSILENRFTSTRIIGGKPRKIVVDKNGNIINRNPSKEELKGLKERTGKKRGRSNKYIDEELLEFLRQFYKENGRVPEQLDFNNNLKYPGFYIYTERFGSWNNAIEMAGLEKDVTYTSNELLEFLRQFYKENGRVPEQLDFNNNLKYPGYVTYFRRFGSWNDALKMAGLKVNVFTKAINDKELLEYLKQFHKENGRSPIETDFSRNPKYPSFYIYHKRFGSWNNAIEMAGLCINRFTEITDSKLLGYLIQFYVENGRSPIETDFTNNPKYPSHQIYWRRFESWQKALKLVGLDVDTMVSKGIIENKYQKSRLAEILVRDHFVDKRSIDVSGDNCNNPIDGICPNDQIYDVKSCGLINCLYWLFALDKRGGVDFYYLLAFNGNRTKLLHVWRIAWNFVDEDFIRIAINSYHRDGHNIENMKEYEITEQLKLSTDKFIETFNIINST